MIHFDVCFKILNQALIQMWEWAKLRSRDLQCPQAATRLLQCVQWGSLFLQGSPNGSPSFLLFISPWFPNATLQEFINWTVPEGGGGPQYPAMWGRVAGDFWRDFFVGVIALWFSILPLKCDSNFALNVLEHFGTVSKRRAPKWWAQETWWWPGRSIGPWPAWRSLVMQRRGVRAT